MASAPSTSPPAGQRRDPAGVGGLGDAGQQLDGLVAATVGDEQLGQRDTAPGWSAQLERLAQRGLVAPPSSARSRVCSADGSSRSTNAWTSRSALGADEAVDDGSVLQGVDRGDALDLELGLDAGVLVDVDLGQHDCAVGGVDHLLEDRSEGQAGTAPRRPQVDDHGGLLGPLHDLGLEGRIGDIDRHWHRIGASPTVPVPMPRPVAWSSRPRGVRAAMGAATEGEHVESRAGARGHRHRARHGLVRRARRRRPRRPCRST